MKLYENASSAEYFASNTSGNHPVSNSLESFLDSVSDFYPSPSTATAPVVAALAGNPVLEESETVNENSVVTPAEEVDLEEDSTSLHSLTDDDIKMLQPGTYLVTAATGNNQSRPATLVLTSSAQKFLVVGAALPQQQQQLQQNIPNIPSPVNEEEEEEAMDADESVLAESLQKTMNKNRESLEIKLLMRRPIEQLVDQGIMPSLKAPAKFHVERKKLERAKMGDYLKHKMQNRPAKSQLVAQNILPDTSVEPGIQEKQEQLKKCKLADNLNDKLSQRPGPLELVQENILHVDSTLEQAIKDGIVQFKPTSAGLVDKNPPPIFLIENSDASSSSNFGEFVLNSGYQVSSSSASSPAPSVDSNPSSAATKKSIGSRKSKGKIIKFHEYKGPAKLKQASPQALLNYSQMQQQPNFLPPATELEKSPSTDSASSLTGLNSVPSSSAETSYDLLLQQQQLLLQWQLELQQKYPNSNIQLMPVEKFAAYRQNSSVSSNTSPLSSPSPQVGQGAGGGSGGGGTFSPPGSLTNSPCVQSQSYACECQMATQPFPEAIGIKCATQKKKASSASTDECSPAAAATKQLIAKLDDMRVCDLKAECKKRNLPVSGPKPNLCDRLKPYEDTIVAEYAAAAASSGAFPTINNANSLPGIQQTFLSGWTQDGAYNNPHFYQFSSPSQVVEAPPVDPGPNGYHEQQINATISDVLGDVGSVLPISAATLNQHEELLRKQQRRIEELQRELQGSQEQLKKQQQVILAARKAQGDPKSSDCEEQTSSTSASSSSSIGAVRDSTDCTIDTVLAQLDTKSLQRLHIQLFLQHKVQQQQLQQQISLHEQLVAQQERLKLEFAQKEALNQLFEVLKEDPAAAEIMLKLYRENRRAEEAITAVQEKMSAAVCSNEFLSMVPYGSQTSMNEKELTAEKLPPNTSSISSSKSQIAKQNSNGTNNENSGAGAEASSSSKKKKSQLQQKNLHSGTSTGLANAAVETSSNNNASTEKKAHSSPNSPKTCVPKATAGGISDAQNAGPPKPQSHFNVDAIFANVMSNAADTLLKYDERLAALELEKQQVAVAANDQDDQQGAEYGPKSQLHAATGVENPAQSETPAMLMADSEHHSVSMPQLSALLDNHQIGGGYVYTKNEAFDDLLEILRNSGELPTSSAESATKFSLNSGGFASADAANFNSSANGIENWCFEQFVDQTQGNLGDEPMEWLDLILPSPSGGTGGGNYSGVSSAPSTSAYCYANATASETALNQLHLANTQQLRYSQNSCDPILGGFNQQEIDSLMNIA